MKAGSVPHSTVKGASNNRLYKLVDKEGEGVKDAWYPEEIQKIEKNRYLIDKILRRRTDFKRGKEVFVKWTGWPKKINTWNPAYDLEYVS